MLAILSGIYDIFFTTELTEKLNKILDKEMIQKIENFDNEIIIFSIITFIAYILSIVQFIGILIFKN